MDVDIELYKVFYIVATTNSITKAAQNLYISQPAVTMSIKKLEDLLKTTLFVRTKRGVILTNEGKVLYEYVKKAMENIKIGENKLENLKKLDTGSIRIGIGTSLTKYFLLEHLELFHKLYPKININIDTSMTDDVLSNLENGKIDLAIIVSDKDDYKGVNIEYSKDIQDIFIANKEFSNLKDSSITLDELNNYPLILQSNNSSTRKFLDNFCTKNNIKLNSVLELANYSLVIEFVRIGMGIGFVAKNYIEKDLKSNELFEVKVSPKIPKRKILILTKKDYLPSFSTSKLIEIIKSNS